MKPAAEEITLREWLLYIHKIWQTLIAFLLFCLREMRQRWMLFILMTIAGYSVGRFMTGTKPPIFETGQALTFNELHKKTYGEMVVLLNVYIEQQQVNRLEEVLQISEPAARSMLYVKALNVAGSPLHEDYSMEKLPFYIKTGLNDTGYFREINRGMLSYLQNNTYSSSRRKVKIENATQKINYITHQLNILDSLKRNYGSALLQNGQGGLARIDLNPERIFREADSLFNASQDANWVLKIDDSVELLYEQAPVSIFQPDHGKRNATLGALSGLLFCFGYILLLRAQKESKLA